MDSEPEPLPESDLRHWTLDAIVKRLFEGDGLSGLINRGHFSLIHSQSWTTVDWNKAAQPVCCHSVWESHLSGKEAESNEYRIIALATSSVFNPADAITHHLNNKASNITRFQHIIKANICISFDWLTKSQCDCGLSRKHPAESYFICRAGCYFQAH